MFVGPLPDPDTLQRYEETHPGIAERILKMAELEQVERHALSRDNLELEKRVQRNLNFNIRLGFLLGFGSVLVSTGMCVFFAQLGNVEAAAGTAKVVIVALAAVFITGKFVSSKNDSKPKKV
jgi:uncharacterized membrane protein